MTDDLPFRPFADDAAVRRVGEGLLACTLPRSEWTHEAHLAACLYLLAARPDIDVDIGIAAIIATYNAAVGGPNDDMQGITTRSPMCRSPASALFWRRHQPAPCRTA